MKDLVIICSGGFGREVLALVQDINSVRQEWNVIGFYNTDVSQSKVPSDVAGIIILSKMQFERLSPNTYLTIASGFPKVKAEIAKELSSYNFPTLIHPSIIKSSRVTISNIGCIVTAGNIITTDVILEDFVTLNLACTVGHDCRISKYSVISPGVNISGNVAIGRGCNIGTGASIIPGKSLGEWVTVGAGAVVSKDLEAGTTAVGVPAKPISKLELIPDFD
jgi:sugar O-acyltransferase (sialic acid O-acetyltransferase NeuD family)